eukprot:COSAG05_NODE_530_length_8907_cov_8.972298_4_plen_36_part_00
MVDNFPIVKLLFTQSNYKNKYRIPALRELANDDGV